MQSADQGRAGLVQRLDTSYTSFRSTGGLRSPRTPTYLPQSPSTRGLAPFDHAEFLDRSASRCARRFDPPPPPNLPTPFFWTCHLCHSRYILGVTRRCLVDGHYYCSGETDRPSLRKRKKRRSCTSEFDYEGWKEWGEWRRNVLQTMENPRLLKGCDYCDYPSQCRSLADIQTLTELAMSTSNTTPRATGAIEGETPNSSSTETGGPEQSVDPLISSAGTPAKERSGKPSNAHPKQPEKNKTAKCSKQAVVARKDRHVVLIPSLQEEMAKEAMKLRELIDMDVWGDLEGKDVDGDIRMIA